ncbi:MAG: type II secretion system protein, partial [Syntrophomonadaceae bacterium]|nr:type II secretion system protein [Syntrophomonadaceae bacterium]
MDRGAHSFSVKNESGFTLVEIMVSLIILLILVVAFVPLFTFVSQAIASNKAKDIAIELSTQKMEELRSLPYVVLNANQQIDTTKPQLGNVGGTPPGSVEPTETVNVNGKDYVITTSITWGDDTKSYKIVSVTVTAPGIFNEAVNITNRFDTMAAQEGIRVQPGSILVKIYDRNGNLLTDTITVTIASTDYNDSDSTSGGEVLFDNLPSGTYSVSALVPNNMTYHPELQPKYNASTHMLVENNITVTYNKQAKVEFIMDTPASINLSIRDQSNNKIVFNSTVTANLSLSWYESDPASLINIQSRTITNSELANGQLASAVSGLWPTGTYILSLKVNKAITDSDFKLYNAYHNNNVHLNSGTNSITANLGSPPVKLVLLGKDNWVESVYNANTKYYAQTWLDQSGNGYNATYSEKDYRPRWKKKAPDKNQMMFEDDDEFLTINNNGVECTNNFTVFVSAQPTVNHGLDTVSDSSTNTDGTAGQKYILYPTQKNDDINDQTANIAGMGISLGKNGVTVYEHGS